jgi:hypothetical protein
MRSIMVDTLQTGHLGWRLLSHLSEEIQKDFARLFERELPKLLLQDGPAEGTERSPLFARLGESTYGQNSAFAGHIAGMRNQFPRCPSELRRHLDRANSYFDNITDVCRQRDLEPYITAPLSPVAWQYFLYCANAQNMRWCKGLFDLWERYDGIRRRIPVEHSTLYYHQFGESGDLFLSELLEIWVDLRSTPKPLVLDLSKSISWNLDYNNSRERLERAQAKAKKLPYKRKVRTEHVFGPMLELSLVIARFCGVFIPNLPFFAMAKRGKHWHKVIERSVAYNKTLQKRLDELSLGEQIFARYEKNWSRHRKFDTLRQG